MDISSLPSSMSLNTYEEGSEDKEEGGLQMIISIEIVEHDFLG